MSRKAKRKIQEVETTVTQSGNGAHVLFLKNGLVRMLKWFYWIRPYRCGHLYKYISNTYDYYTIYVCYLMK